MSNLPMTTVEVAKAIRRNPFTLRAAVRRKGHYYGITPTRHPDGGFLWPADTVERLLGAAENHESVAA